jgi:transposase
MRDIIEKLDENLVYVNHEITDDCITIYVVSSRDEVSCPYCGKVSSRIHSVYERSFQDLPVQGQKAYVSVANRKYFCDNPACTHTTFAESFDCLKPKAKKSGRLVDEIMKISLEVSSLSEC